MLVTVLLSFLPVSSLDAGRLCGSAGKGACREITARWEGFGGITGGELVWSVRLFLPEEELRRSTDY